MVPRWWPFGIFFASCIFNEQNAAHFRRHLNLHYLHRFWRINEDAHFQNHVQLLRRSASDPQHSSISLTANSAIAGGVLGTNTPGLRQCDIGRRGKQSTWQSTINSSVMNAAAWLVCCAWMCDHITPLLQDFHWLRVPQRIEFKLAVLAFRCLHRARYGTAIPCMRTAPCGRHGLLTATSFCFHGRAEHSTNMSCHRWWPRLWYMTEPRDTVTFNFFLLLSALEFFFWLYGTLIMFIILIIIRPHHVWKYGIHPMYGIHPICDSWD